MDDLYQTIVGVVLTAVVGIGAWLWNRLDAVNTRTLNHDVRISSLESDMSDHKKIPERIASLETAMTLNMNAIRQSIEDLRKYFMGSKD